MGQQSVMIDMDDVMVRGGFLYLINEYLGTSYTEDDFNDFHMQNIIPDKQDFFKYFLTKNLYDYCEINEYADVVIKELMDYYQVYIGTAYVFPEVLRESGIILLHKYNFLLEKFPYLTPQNFVFLMDKSVLNCTIKIDDSIKNLSGAERKLLYTAYHNKNIEKKTLESQKIERVDGWLDVRRRLLKK